MASAQEHRLPPRNPICTVGTSVPTIPQAGACNMPGRFAEGVRQCNALHLPSVFPRDSRPQYAMQPKLAHQSAQSAVCMAIFQ